MKNKTANDKSKFANMVIGNTKHLQMYERLQAPESMRRYGCDSVVFNESVNDTLYSNESK